MLLTNEWYFFVSAVDKKTCNKLKGLAKNPFEDARIDTNDRRITEQERMTGRIPTPGIDKTKRVTEICWVHEQWMYDLIWPYMLEANKLAGWKFEIKSAESLQISKYKKGGHYTWHRDGYSDCLSTYDKPDNKFFHGIVRKISMTLLLNDNYEGGEFQFSRIMGGEPDVATPEFSTTGSIIFFPSYLEHRVAPVTKGTRYSVVLWFLGPPFK